MIKEWIQKLLRTEKATYTEEEKKKLDAQKAEARLAVRHSERQEVAAKNIRHESEEVGHQMRELGRENHFAYLVRRSFLEGR